MKLPRRKNEMMDNLLLVASFFSIVRRWKLTSFLFLFLNEPAMFD